MQKLIIIAVFLRYTFLTFPKTTNINSEQIRKFAYHPHILLYQNTSQILQILQQNKIFLL